MSPQLDRVEFRREQDLEAGDLEQASRRTADLLNLHAARGHDVWGVATGYLCTLDPERGVVVVGPGIALDAHGRQMITATQRLVPLPPHDGAPQIFDLVGRWAQTADLAGGCGPRGMPAEQVALRWEAAGPAPADRGAHVPWSPRVRMGTDVPITRLTTGPDATVDTSSRPVAHALVRPKIATGRVLQSTVAAAGTFADWRVTVPTAEAGFAANSSPVYLVALDAHPLGDTASLGRTAEPPDTAVRLRWPGPFVSVENKDAGSFTLRVVTASGPGWARDNSPGTNPVAVTWVGIDTPDAGPFAWQIFLPHFFSVVIR